MTFEQMETTTRATGIGALTKGGEAHADSVAPQLAALLRERRLGCGSGALAVIGVLDPQRDTALATHQRSALRPLSRDTTR
jgi:hypothetical protein